MPPDDDRFSQLEERLQLARDQVDELQVQAQEKRKPWYRQTPSLPSLLALLLSIATAVYSAYERQQQDVHGKKEELRRLVTSLVDLGMEYQAKFATKEAAAMPQPQRDMMSGMFNRKRIIYLEDADHIVRQIPKHVSSSAYEFLASEMTATGNPQAIIYLERAVEASKEPFTKIVSLRSLGFMYAGRGPHQDMEKARQRFKQAVALIPSETKDEAMAYTLGYTLEMWAAAEGLNGFKAESAQKIESARKYYSSLSPANNNRQSALTFLEARVQSAIQAAAQPPATPIPAPPVPGLAP